MRRFAASLLASAWATATAAHPLGADGTQWDLALMGMALPLSRPELVLALLAAGLLVAMGGRARLELAVPVVAVLAIAGVMSPRYADFGPSTPLLCAAVLASCMAALAIPAARPLAAGVAGLCGWLAGYASMVLLAEHAESPPVSVMAGALLTIVAATAVVGRAGEAALTSLPDPIGRTVLRIAASWIAAISLMLIALNLKA